VTHKQFLGGIGHAIIHSKVVVIDPFSKERDPVVITGSHNFSSSASSKNDENFIIVKGDRELAEAYAVNIFGAYTHYRWRAFLSQTHKPFNGLKDSDAWQARSLAGARRDFQFWTLGPSS
jgi:phosphatidylserine/phosphatidylglycerophosphate/cardiolipin synthase-like enzyme